MQVKMKKNLVLSLLTLTLFSVCMVVSIPPAMAVSAIQDPTKNDGKFGIGQGASPIEVLHRLVIDLGFLGPVGAGQLPLHVLTECPAPNPSCTAPDLVPDMGTLVGEPTFAWVKREFKEGSLEVVEGQVPGPGLHYLLRFGLNAGNIGQDFNIGAVPPPPADTTQVTETDRFIWSPTHHHWHLKNLYLLELLDQNNVVAVHAKLSLATGDVAPYCTYAANTPPVHDFVNNQGISPGFLDAYVMFLPGQFVVVDNMKPGNYTLRLTVNPNCSNSERLTEECDCTNNTMEVRVKIPPKEQFAEDQWALLDDIAEFLFTLGSTQSEGLTQ